MDNSTPGPLSRYLDGEMAGQERKEFEKLLETDEQMRNELTELQLAREAIKIYGLKRDVSELHEEMIKEFGKETPIQNINNSKKTFRYTLAIAATIALLIVGYLAFNFFSLSSDRLFSQQFSSYELTVLRDNVGAQTTIQKLYRQGNYRAVIDEKSRATDLSTADLFFTALSYLELNDAPSSINGFNDVLTRDKNSGEKIYKDQSEYYLALAYLKNKDLDKALELMQAIHNDSNHPYHEKFTNSFIRKVKMLKWR